VKQAARLMWLDTSLHETPSSCHPLAGGGRARLARDMLLPLELGFDVAKRVVELILRVTAK